MRKTVKLAIAIAWICILLGIVCVGAATVAVGFDFEKLNTTEMIQGEFTLTGDFSEIDIHSLSADVRLMLAEDDICRVEYETRSDVSWKIAHGKLFVETEKSDPIVHIGIGFFNEHVNIYLPKDTYESLTIDTTSGDVYVFPAFDVVKTVKISSSSGDISFIGTVSESLTAESTSGSVLIREPNAKAVYVKTTSGEVTLSAVYASTVSVKTTSGDVDLESVTAKETLTVNTGSGDIELYCDAGEIHLESTSGDIEGSIGSAKHYIVDTTSGTVRIPPNDTSANICEIHTTSGDIEIRTARDAVNSFNKD